MNPSRDDSQIALRIATASAVFSVFGFLVYTILVDSLQWFSVPIFSEVIIKCVIVILSVVFANTRVQEAFTVQNYGQIPFLSTIFFYCVTLLIVYMGQILFVIFHLFFSTNINLMQELKFILWIGDMTVSWILNSLFVGHIPYLAYFFFLKYKLSGSR